MRHTCQASRVRAPRRWLAQIGLFLGDERGDEGVNKILIIALVSIPLVLVLIFFGQEIVNYLTDAWDDLAGTEETTIADPRKNPFGR